MTVRPQLRRRSAALGRALRLLRSRTLRYQRIARWIGTDSLWRFRRGVVRFLMLSGITLVLQAGALAVLLSYARTLESGSAIALGSFSTEPRLSVSLLIAAIGTSGVMLLVASVLRLHAERGCFAVAARYGMFCAQRLTTLLATALHSSSRSGRSLDQAALRKLTTGGSQICSRVMYGLLNTLPSIMALAVYTGFLIYLDARLSLFILSVMALSVFAFYRLSIGAAALMRERAARKRMMGDAHGGLVDYLKRAPAPLAPDHPLFEARMREGAFPGFFTEFFRSQAVGAQTAFVGSIAQAATLAAIGLVKGGEIIATGSGFGDLVVFLVAGRMAIGAFFGITGSLVMVNRFYPTVAEYFASLRELQELSATMAPGGGGRWLPLTVKLVVPSLAAPPAGSAATPVPPWIRPGGRLALITAATVDRFMLPALLDALRTGPQEGRPDGRRIPPALCWVIPDAPAAIDIAFNEAAGLPADATREWLCRELRSFGISDTLLAAVPDRPDAMLDADGWRRLDPAAFHAAQLLAASRALRPLTIVGAPVLAAFGEPRANAILDSRFADRIVLVARQPKQAGRTGVFGETHALLFDGEAVLGYLTPAELAADPEIIKRARSHRTAGEAGRDLMEDET